MQAAGTEQPDETDDDQVDRDDIVQQSRRRQDQDASDQRHDGSDRQMEIHRYLVTAGWNWRADGNSRSSFSPDPYVRPHWRGV